MRNYILWLVVAFTVAACNKETKQTIAYNDAIVDAVEQADSTVRDLFSFRDFEEYPSRKEGYNKSFLSIRETLDAIPSHDRNDSLRLVAIELVDTYHGLVDGDFLAIYTLMHDSLYTVEDSVSVDSISAEMYAKWQIQSERFASQQKRFSREMGMELVKD